MPATSEITYDIEGFDNSENSVTYTAATQVFTG